MQSLYRHYLFVSLLVLLLLLLSTSVSAQSSSCTPLDCVAQCQPNCSGADICVLSTMSNCGQCPASKCMSRSALGISSPSDNNSSHETSTTSSQQQDDNNNDSLIGGLVGGLVGGGLIIGGLALCIYRSRRRNMTCALPFQPTKPYHHQQPQQQPSRILGNKSTLYPSSSDAPRSIFETTRNSTCHSITSGVIPIAYIPPSHQIDSSPHINTTSMTTTTAVENPFQDPHHSPYTTNTTATPTTTNNNNYNDDDDGDDMSSRHHSILSADQQHPSHHAIQVTRAKPQILRVSSLRRNGSVPTLSTKPNQGNVFLTCNSATDLTTVTLTLRGDQDPFQTNHDSNEDDDDDLGSSSRPSMNHSLGSTLGDGEITIFWHGQQQQQQ